MPNNPKVVMVNYSNTKPFMFGFENHELANQFDLTLKHPADCAKSFANGEADIALVPVGFLKGRTDYRIITEHCIGCISPVYTVCLLSNAPINEISKIFLDNHSVSSAGLTRILIDEYWRQEVKYETIDIANEQVSIKENEAILMIGDKVFEEEHNYEFKYDLGAVWNEHTNLPFTFAVWIAKKELDIKFDTKLEDILSFGTMNMENVILGLKSDKIDYKTYLNEHISYTLTPLKRKALHFFLSKL